MATVAMPDEALFDGGVMLEPGTDTRPPIARPVDRALGSDADAAAAWVSTHKDLLDGFLAEHGVLLLRGFAARTTEEFAQIVACYPSPSAGYSGGATPRASVAGRVFEATQAAADIHMMLHQEMAYLPHWPKKLAFYCAVAPDSGGETLFGDVRRYEPMIDRGLWNRVKQLGVQYRRNFRTPDAPFPDVLKSAHRTWTEAFYTDDPQKAEDDVVAMGMEPRWEADGSLSAIYSASGFVRHPITGEERWFNHIASQTMTPASLRDRWPTYAAHYADGRPQPYDVRFGDGTPIPLDDVTALFPKLDSVTVAYPWQAGDILFIDNVQTFHGRNPYTGHRNVQVALLEEASQ